MLFRSVERGLSDLTPPLVRLRRRLRRDGMWSTAKAFFAVTCPRRYDVYRLATLSEPCSVADIRLSLGLDDLRRCRAGNEDLPDEFYAEYKPGAHDCVLASAGAAPAGIIWILRGVQASRFVLLGPGDAELSFLYVLPPYRGRGLAKVLYWRAAQLALDSGMEQIFAVIRSDNLPSAHAAKAVGFRKIADLWRPAWIGPRLRWEPDRARIPAGNG